MSDLVRLKWCFLYNLDLNETVPYQVIRRNFIDSSIPCKLPKSVEKNHNFKTTLVCFFPTLPNGQRFIVPHLLQTKLSTRRERERDEKNGKKHTRKNRECCLCACKCVWVRVKLHTQKSVSESCNRSARRNLSFMRFTYFSTVKH